MKKNFMTGFVMILPLAITLVLLNFILNFVTKPFVGPVAHFLNHFHILDEPFYIFSGEEIVQFSSRFIALIALIIITLFLGFIGNLFFYQTIVRVTDAVFTKIPLINKVYKASQDVIVTLCHKDKPAFSQVVMVPFPHSGVKSLGLITKDHNSKEDDAKGSSLVSVFVPATPNPTFGFMLVYKQEQLIPLNITVQQALTYIVSAGAILPNQKKP
jgi:uncharacterized membrane protein